MRNANDNVKSYTREIQLHLKGPIAVLLLFSSHFSFLFFSMNSKSEWKNREEEEGKNILIQKGYSHLPPLGK